MSSELTDVARFGIAGLVGLAVGIEREWSGHASGPKARFAGVRTFFVLGLLGGTAGLLLSWSYEAAGVALLAAGALFVSAAYLAAIRRDPSDLDGTTEAAALLVLALSALAGLGHLVLASGAVALVVLALREKEGLHALVRNIGKTELRATLQFAVLALVVLPLLPSGPYGPFGGIRPRALWGLVLILAGLNFAGYLARNAAGAARGYTITGLLGGIASSTAVTFQFARKSRLALREGEALARGVVAACTVLVLRVAIVATALNPDVARALAWYLVPPFVAGAIMTVFALSAHREQQETRDEEKNPLALVSALKMAALFQVAIMLVAAVNQYWGTRGVIATSAALGMTDMDALTISMTRFGHETSNAAIAATGIAAGLLSNTVVKLGIALAMGSRSFRLQAGAGLGVLALASGVGIWIAS